MKYFVKLNANSPWQEGRLLALSTNCALLGGVLFGTKMASQSAENLPGYENTEYDIAPPPLEKGGTQDTITWRETLSPNLLF